MSRRKKSPRGRGPHAKPVPRQEQPPADRVAEASTPSRGRPAIEPNPPRPNKPLLLATGVLLLGWIALLVVLAATT